MPPRQEAVGNGRRSRQKPSALQAGPSNNLPAGGTLNSQIVIPGTGYGNDTHNASDPSAPGNKEIGSPYSEANACLYIVDLLEAIGNHNGSKHYLAVPIPLISYNSNSFTSTLLNDVDHVFPVDGPWFTLALPFQLGKFAVSPEGNVLYGPRFFDPSGPNTGLYKIEFGPTRATRLPGSEGLASIYGIAASSTKIVVSAGHLPDAGLLTECGLYELMLSSSAAHKILSNSDCKYASSWSSISLSPDSRRIVAVRKHRLELIDTEKKAVRSVGDGFHYAAWSPDGRWIAALGDNGEHTVLIDASDPDKRRTLPPSEVIWSPDSVPF